MKRALEKCRTIGGILGVVVICGEKLVLLEMLS